MELLGYVNNLVERDGVKVLLVANENQILNKTPELFDFDFTPRLFSTDRKNNDEETNKKDIPEDIQKYLRIKEKTISDTIYFESNYCEAVKNNKAFRSLPTTKIIFDLSHYAERPSGHQNRAAFSRG